MMEVISAVLFRILHFDVEGKNAPYVQTHVIVWKDISHFTFPGE